MLRVVLLVFGAAIALGLLRSVAALVLQGHPDPGWGYYVYDDALQLSSGHWTYEDPASGYVGLLYPPLYTGAVAGLMKAHLWSGWGVLVSALASVGLSSLVGLVAYRRDHDGAPAARGWRIAEAAAVGAVGWWLVTADPYPGSFDFRPDASAWALGLLGLLLAPRGLRGSRAALIGSVVALTAAFWAKQPAAAAGVAAGLWAVLAAIAGVTSRRRAAAFVGALAALNLAVLGLLSLATGGWAFFYIFALARRHDWAAQPWHAIVEHSAQVLWLPALFAAVVLGAGVAARGRRRAVAEDRDVQQLVLLLLFLAVALPLETYFQRKQGALEEHLIGVLWGLALLAALGWRLAGRAAGARIAVLSAVAVLGLVGLLVGARVDGGLDHVPRIGAVTRFPEVPAQLRALARGHTLYDPRWSDLGTRDGHVPTSYVACDLNAGGVTPTALAGELATRRYDLVTPFPEGDAYCSGNGRWEESYFWKLNRVIDAGYQPLPGTYPTRVLERRPDARAAAAARALLRCFAPYRLAGALFRIGHGGGFWCPGAPAGATLTLGAIPATAPFSEVLTDGTVRSVSGVLGVTLPAGAGSVTVSVQRSGQVDRIAQLGAATPGQAATTLLAFGGAAPAAPAGTTVRRIAPDRLRGGRLVLAATAQSGARFDLSALKIDAEGGILRGAITRRGS